MKTIKKISLLAVIAAFILVACYTPGELPLSVYFLKVAVEGTSIKVEWGSDFYEVVITRYVYKNGLGGEREREWAGKFEQSTTVYYDNYNLVRGYFYQYEIQGNEPGEGAFSTSVLYDPPDTLEQ